MNALLKPLAAALFALCATTGSQAQTITLKVHHFLGPQSIQHTKMLATWCDNIARDSGNRLNCQIYPAMQLGGTPPQLFDQAKDGVADVVWTVAGLLRRALCAFTGVRAALHDDHGRPHQPRRLGLCAEIRR